MGNKKVTKESPPLAKRGPKPGDPDTGIKELVEAAMNSRGEWVSIERTSSKNVYTGVRAKVGAMFCEFSVAGGERMYLRIRTEDEL